MAALNFNPLQYDPIGEFTVYPAGWYPMAAKSSEVKAAANQQNGYLQLNCEILDGPHKGGIYAWRFNLYNQNETARDIAHRMLATLCFACGVAPLNDSAQLHGIPFNVLLEEREMDYRATDDRSKPKRKANEVTAIRDIHGNAPGKPGNGAAGSSAAPSSAPGSAPPMQQPPMQQPPQQPPAEQPPAQGWTPPAQQPPVEQQQQPPANAGWTPPAQAQQPPQQPPAQGGWQPPAQGATPPPAAPWGPPA